MHVHRLLKSSTASKVDQYILKATSLPEYQLLTTHANELNVDGNNYDLFPDKEDKKEVCYHVYEQKTRVLKRKGWGCTLYHNS